MVYVYTNTVLANTSVDDALQILLNATPRYDAAGNVVGVIGIGQDETQELSQQQDLLRLIATANAPIIGIDRNSCINEWNQKAATLTGFSREEAMGKPLVEEFIEQPAQASVQAVLDDALQGTPNDNYHFFLKTRSKQPLQIILNATPWYDASGSVVSVIGIGQDVTGIVDKEVAERANAAKRRFLAYGKLGCQRRGVCSVAGGVGCGGKQSN